MLLHATVSMIYCIILLHRPLGIYDVNTSKSGNYFHNKINKSAKSFTQTVRT